VPDEKHKIKINLTAAGVGSAIEIDGVAVPNVRSIRVDASVREVTTVTLEVLALHGVEITGEVSKVEKKTVDAAIPIHHRKPEPPPNQEVGGTPGHLKFNGVYWECGLIPWCEHRNKFAAFLHRLLLPFWPTGECKH
jgi:hypothetical protein